MDDRPMTKTEAQSYVRRAREGLRQVEAALRHGDTYDLQAATNEVIGSMAAIQSALEYGAGVKGVDTPQ